MHPIKISGDEGERDIPIKGLTADSRQVRGGYLFAALPGNKVDGRDYIADAIRHGASVILAPQGTVLPNDINPSEVALIVDQNPRQKLAQLAAHFYGLQPQFIVGITGTSGKTSTAAFTQQLWHLSGTKECASLGTLGVRGPDMVRSASHTTPDPVSLHAELADLAAVGITHLAMECSSHGLDQFRLDGVNIQAAAFTNLSRDHLDYHADMDSYFEAKARLFSDLLPKEGTAVIAADDVYAPVLIERCKKRGQKLITVGVQGQDIILKSRKAKPTGQDIEIIVEGKTYGLTLPLVGEFQVMNALCAIGLVMASGKKAEDLVPLVEKLRGVPGRLQLIQGHPKGAAVYIDYAHKPAALELMLKTLRPHTKGRLFCVFGCGGDRDPGKRPLMGKIAMQGADVVVVTDDNPRSEDPQIIREQITEAAPGSHEIADRREAIVWAVEQIEEGDVLVVAGKGHEQGQIIGDEVHPFDDTEEVQKAMESV